MSKPNPDDVEGISVAAVEALDDAKDENFGTAVDEPFDGVDDRPGANGADDGPGRVGREGKVFFFEIVNFLILVKELACWFC